MTIYKVKYKDQEYELKHNLKSIFAFEELTGKYYELKSTYDLFNNIYCMFIGNGYNIDYNEFMDYVDEHFEFINDFYTCVISEPEKKETEEADIKKKK
jgi:hypothetical protein